MKLTDKQTIHLRRVKTANDGWRKAKMDAAAHARLIAEREVETYRNAMDLEVRQAFDAGVPKAQIRTLGMATTNNEVINDSLARTEGLVRIQKEFAEAMRISAWKEGKA